MLSVAAAEQFPDIYFPRPTVAVPLTEQQRKKLEEAALRKRLAYQKRIRERRLKLFEDAYREAIAREKALANRSITFKIQRQTCFGQNVFILGSNAKLGAWNPENALQLHWNEGHFWTAQLTLPASSEVYEYKYVVKMDNGGVEWEPGNNHRVDVRKVQGSVLLEDSWGAAK